MFGKTQAGKSTFIEYIRNYVDPLYMIDRSLIGNTVKSKTGMTKRFTVTSDLPTYEVCHNGSDAPIDTDALCQSCIDMDDYADAIKNKETTLRLALQNPNPRPLGSVTIQFLDTPGINDTDYRDVEYAQEVIKEMIKIQSFNLIVVLINIEVPMHQEQCIMFNYYSRVIHTLQGDHSNIVFVYTHVPYKCRHQHNAGHSERMEKTHRAYSSLFRDRRDMSREVKSDLATAAQDRNIDLYPHYTIDLQTHRPICKCMMQETLRDILRLAVTKPGVSFDISQENLDRVWAIKHPDEDNYKQHLKRQARKQAEDLLLQRRKAEKKEHEPVLLDGIVEAVGSLSVQAIESQDSDLPDGVVFNSEDDADSDEGDD